jgi:uncharacterized protein (DUF2267 family)
MSNQDLESFYQFVQEKGQLRSREHAYQWSEGVLRTLGENLDRGTKRSLAKALPDELADWLTRVFYLLHFRNKELSSQAFQKKAALRSGNTDARFARQPVIAVFGGVRPIIDSNLDRQVADTLSPEVRELWQQTL